MSLKRSWWPLASDANPLRLRGTYVCHPDKARIPDVCLDCDPQQQQLYEVGRTTTTTTSIIIIVIIIIDDDVSFTSRHVVVK